MIPEDETIPDKVIYDSTASKMSYTSYYQTHSIYGLISIKTECFAWISIA